MPQVITQESLYRDFLNEKKTNRRWELAGYIVGYGAYAIILSIVFILKRENPQLSALFFFGLLTRASSLLIGRVYLIPKIFFGLLSEDTHKSENSWETIVSHKEEIVGRLARNLYGWNDASELYEMDRVSMADFIRENSKFDWRKIGKYYLIFYIPASILLVSLTIAAWYE